MGRIIPEMSRLPQELFLPSALRKSSHVVASQMSEICGVKTGNDIKSIEPSVACHFGWPGFTERLKKE